MDIYQLFWVQKDIPVNYSILWNIARLLFYHFLKKKIKLDTTHQGYSPKILNKLNINNVLLLKHQLHPSTQKHIFFADLYYVGNIL